MVNRPTPQGEYAVGTITYTIYNERDEALEEGAKRNVCARVYYPVLKESVEGMSKSRYMSKNVADGLKKALHVPINYEKLEAEGDNISECYQDAPMIKDKKFPLVVFNHGYMSYREANSFLCIEIASHGYVVISVGHPFECACCEFDDGTFVFSKNELAKRQYEPFLGGALKAIKLTQSKGTNRELAEQFNELQNKYSMFLQGRINEWVLDTEAAVKYAKENLADLIDFSCGIAATGHSIGGATAYKLCIDNPEFVCGLNLDGALFGDTFGKILEKPFLQFSCKGNLKAETRSFIDHTKIVYGVVVKDMAHVGFSDMKHMVKIAALTGRLDADEAHKNICKCHLEFLDTYLKKIKDKPDIESNDAITVTEYAPDR